MTSTDAQLGLKTTDLTMLAGFTLKPGVSPLYLATCLELRQGQARRAVRRLEKAGLIRSFTGNQKSYAPTEAGERVSREWIAAHEVRDIEPDLLDCLRKLERRTPFPRWRARVGAR